MMLRVIVLLLSLGAGVACAQVTNTATGSPRRTPLSSAELEQIAKHFVKSNKIDFVFEGTRKYVWVSTNGSRYFTHLSFSSGLGNPCFEIDIDPRGNVISNSVGVAVCGAGDPSLTDRTFLRSTNKPSPAPK
jgi:hypothetical protein